MRFVATGFDERPYALVQAAGRRRHGAARDRPVRRGVRLARRSWRIGLILADNRDIAHNRGAANRDGGRAVALGDTDRHECVRLVLVFPGLDDVVVDRARLAQTGQRIAPHGRPAVDHRDVLQRLHGAETDLTAQLHRQHDVLRLIAVLLGHELRLRRHLRELHEFAERGGGEDGAWVGLVLAGVGTLVRVCIGRVLFAVDDEEGEAAEQACAGDRLAGLEVGEEAVAQWPPRDGHLDLDVVRGERVEVEVGELRLAGLDARDKVGLGQARDAREVHQREGGGAEGLLASLGAIGPAGDLRLALARGLGQQVGVDAGADEVADEVDRVTLAVERVAPQIGIGGDVGVFGE